MATLTQRLALEQGLYNTDLNGRAIPSSNLSAGVYGSTPITLLIDGALTTSSAVTMRMPYRGKITSANVAVTTAPTGSALTADLKVGSNVAATFSIAISGTSDEGTLTPANCTFEAGDLVSLDISAVGSTIAGSNIVCTFMVDVYYPTWQATNATISYETENFFINNVYVMKIQPTTAAINNNLPIVISLDVSNTFDADDAAAIFVAHAQFKCAKANYTTSLRLTNTTDDALDVANQYPTSTNNVALDKDHIGGSWSVARSNVMTSPANWPFVNYTFTITITNFDSRPIYMTSPTLVLDNYWLANYAVINMKRKMPDLYWDYDSLATNPTYPFFRFIDVLTYKIGETMETYSRWRQQEVSEIPYDLTSSDSQTRSTLTNPSTSYSEYSPWLFQFVGVPRVSDIQDGGVSWLTDGTEDFRVWQLENSYFGRAAGTTQAIEAAVRKVLTGNKTITITANPGDWEIVITTLDSETPSDNAVVQAAELARPLGFTVTHTSSASIGFIIGNITQGIIGTSQL